jgi:Phage portal protein, SPP1 Gp6-like
MREVNPIPEVNRAMLAEQSEAKFGQLDAANLTGYENAVNILLGQIMAVSTLPAHYVGVMHDNPASADALRAAEASLTARAEARQATFGRAWEQVARLMVAVASGRDPVQIEARVQWADAATRSDAQAADATVKLVQAGVLPVSYALKKLGYSADEIAEIRVARRTETLDTAGVTLPRTAA